MMPLPSTRDRLRAVAAERFGLRGYEGTSMSDLAERVGVTKATLYSHYPSKEALLVELFEDAITDWAKTGHAALAGSAPLLVRLRTHLEASLAWTETHPHQAAVVQVAATRVAGELGSRLRGRLDELADMWLALLAEHFRVAAANRELTADEIPALLELWRVVCDGLFSVAVLRPESQPRPGERLAQIWPALERAFLPRD